MDIRFILVALALASPALSITLPQRAQAQVQAPAQAQAKPAEAGQSAAIKAFSKALMIGDVLDVMRAEGIANSIELSDSLFPGENAAAWAAVVSMIYDTGKMHSRFDAALAVAVGNDSETLKAAQVFFASDLGQQIMTLEIAARRTLLNKAAEATAKESWAGLVAEKAARADHIIRFGGANDLIESNVMGALNANLAFYRGLSGARGFGDAMSEDQMLAEVWGQELDIRRDTTEWLYPFLSLAYKPLTDAELDRYTAFSETDAGQKINAAIFVAFDAVMGAISADLGQAAGRLMAGQDI